MEELREMITKIKSKIISNKHDQDPDTSQVNPFSYLLDISYSSSFSSCCSVPPCALFLNIGFFLHRDKSSHPALQL
jgi:hypothetical protein